MAGKGAWCVVALLMTLVFLSKDKSPHKRRIDKLSQRTGRPSSFYIKEALGAHLSELEYVYLLEEEAAEIRRGEVGTVSLNQLENECGLGD